MNSHLKFFDYDTGKPSPCGNVLSIEFSSHSLNWPGVVLEKGNSPHFHPQNVYTPYFYFALALDEDLNWRAKTEQGLTALKTSPGDIWINPPNTPFSHNIDEPCYFVILAVEEAEFFDACTLNISAREKLQFLNNYNVHDETIKGIIDLFLLEASGGGRNGAAYLKNLLSLLSTHYIQSYSNFLELQHDRQNTSKFDQSQVDKIDRFIEQHIGQNVTVDSMAERLNCSKFYFLREFKKLMGITPYQYLMNKRLQLAKSKLLVQDSNIAAIAFELGFNDQSHLTRSFKNQFGMSPGQFQKQQP